MMENGLKFRVDVKFACMVLAYLCKNMFLHVKMVIVIDILFLSI